MMPWEAILAGGFPTLLFFLFGYFLYTAIGKASTVVSNHLQETRRAELAASEDLRKSNLEMVVEMRKSSLAFVQSVDTDLRNSRIEVYQKLWRMTEIFPLYPRRKPTNYGELLPFGESMRDWYFQVGGIFMSESTRDAYFALQNEITSHIERDKTGVIEDLAYEQIRTKCSALRTELTEDLLSRRAAPEVKPR